MPRYQYKGRNKAGKEIKGIMDAAQESAVALELIRTGVTPLSVVLRVEKKSIFSEWMQFLELEMPSVQDMNFMSRQMYALLKSGVPIVRSVKVVLESAKNIRLKTALLEVLTHLESGQSLSFALKQHPRIFPSLLIALVQVGENTGSLDKVFHQMSLYFERDANTRKQISTAFRYPVTVLSVIVVAVSVINIFVIPAFAKFFSHSKVALPLPTQLLIATSNFFVQYWYFLGGMGVAVSAAFAAYIRTPKGRRGWDRIKIQIPFVGDIMKRAMMARFARSFALSVKTGVPLLEALLMIANTTDNVYVSEKMLSMRTYIEHGESLTVSATKSGMFTPLVLQMLAIGEETGEIDRLLDEVADYYEQEVDYDVKRLGAAIEPVLILTVAGFVLILALGIFLPMWDLWKGATGQ